MNRRYLRQIAQNRPQDGSLYSLPEYERINFAKRLQDLHGALLKASEGMGAMTAVDPREPDPRRDLDGLLVELGLLVQDELDRANACVSSAHEPRNPVTLDAIKEVAVLHAKRCAESHIDPCARGWKTALLIELSEKVGKDVQWKTVAARLQSKGMTEAALIALIRESKPS
jgi:hypothetical protein